MFLRFHTTLLTALVVAIALATACDPAPVPAAAPTPVSEPAAAATQQPAEPVATPSPEPAQSPASVPSPAAVADVSDVEVVEGDFGLAEDGGFFLEMLGFVPDTSYTRNAAWIQSLAPLWSAFEEVGFERPGPEAPDDWADSFIPGAYVKVKNEPDVTLRPLVRTPFIGFPRGYSQDVPHYQYVGFDIRSVDESLLVEGEQSGFQLAVVRGRYDPERTAAHLAACAECVEAEVNEYKGVTYYAWGEDFDARIRRRLEPPLFDPLGRGGRLAVGDGYALRSLHTAGIKGMIDAIKGDVPTLADAEDYQLAARALVGLNAYGGGMASRSLSLEEFDADCPCDMSGLSVDERIEIIKSRPLLEPFSLAAMGHAFDSDEAPTHLVLVLVHEDSRAAETNAERLVDRLRLEYSGSEDVIAPDALLWGNQIGFVEVSVDGRVLLAKLYESRDKATDSTTWPYWVLFGGGVLIHE